MELWYGLSAAAQDALTAATLLAPLVLIAAVLLPGHRPLPLAAALARRHAGIGTVFVALIAVSVAVGAGLLAQERALRAASASAADPFDLVIAAPGSEVTMLLATVFLQPSDTGLIPGALLGELAADPRVALAAPVAFGDSVDGAPVVGTTQALVDHLSGGAIEGAPWDAPFDAVIGADVAAAVGDHLHPAHGAGEDADEHAHDEVELHVTGRMPRTGTPWDRAVLVPVEALWRLHGLADGHAGPARLGPPFDPDRTPGLPAIVVRAKGLADSYSLRADWSREGATMAFFPGAVLARLHGLMGDVRRAMSVMAVVSLGLVAVSVLAGLVLLSRLFRRHLALLGAMGAPPRFVAGVMWSHAAGHLAAGAVLGLLLARLSVAALSSVVSARTGMAVSATLGVPETLLVAGFAGAAALAALGPALWLATREPVSGLR